MFIGHSGNLIDLIPTIFNGLWRIECKAVRTTILAIIPGLKFKFWFASIIDVWYVIVLPKISEWFLLHYFLKSNFILLQ